MCVHYSPKVADSTDSEPLPKMIEDNTTRSIACMVAEINALMHGRI